MTKVTIDRELLERVVKADASNGASSVDLVDGWKAMDQIRAILAAPRQPLSARVPCKEFDKLYAQMLDEYQDEMAKAAGDIRKMSDPRQPEVGGLREECEMQRNTAAGAHNQLTANRLETEQLAKDWMAAAAERDALRQQRDKLAGLLDEVTDEFVVNYLDSDLIKRIDATLAEVGK